MTVSEWQCQSDSVRVTVFEWSNDRDSKSDRDRDSESDRDRDKDSSAPIGVIRDILAIGTILHQRISGARCVARCGSPGLTDDNDRYADGEEPDGLIVHSAHRKMAVHEAYDGVDGHQDDACRGRGLLRDSE